jgi:hypothetical protein
MVHSVPYGSLSTKRHCNPIDNFEDKPKEQTNIISHCALMK